MESTGGDGATDAARADVSAPKPGNVDNGTPVRRRVFVMLPSQLDTTDFFELFQVGLKADRSPWGLGWPADFGFDVEYSAATLPHGARGFLQRSIRAVVGTDLAHGWANRKAINRADVILTHMEREWVAAAFAIQRGGSGPRLIANTIWLPGEWSSRNVAWKWAVNRARAKVACFTFNARPALEEFERRFGTQVPCRFVPFGVSWESFVPAVSEPDADLPVLVAGDDRYRDWALLGTVAAALADVRFLVASKSAPADLGSLPNVEIIAAKGPHDMQQLYERCAVSFIPLQPNLHASGITVALETARVGRPIVVTDTGGMCDYFAAHEVGYITPGDASDAIGRIQEIRGSPQRFQALVDAATTRINVSRYDSRSFAERLMRAAGELE
jgi:glycosyltransferase involved in cell wall biosynthesis